MKVSYDALCGCRTDLDLLLRYRASENECDQDNDADMDRRKYARLFVISRAPRDLCACVCVNIMYTCLYMCALQKHVYT